MHVNRREFLLTVASASGAAALSATVGPAAGQRSGQLTVQDAIDRILLGLPSDPDPDTVDTVKIGDPSRPLTGIATTFLATARIIERAADGGANLVITHEPTFYNHLDEVDWLQGDYVYRAKVDLIERHDIVVWRLHDHVHRSVQDDLTRGVIHTLDWEAFASEDDNYLCTVPDISLRDLALFMKGRLGSESVRIIGDPDMSCSNVGILMGAWGGQRQIEMLMRPDVDVVVCGEVREWETAEYVRDAHRLGFSKGLVVVGHAVSEEPGMLWMTEWIRRRIPEVEVTHLPAGDPFAYL